MTDIHISPHLNFLGRAPREDQDPREEIGALIRTVARTLVSRAFMASSRGVIGLGPEWTKVGDSICFIPGNETPLLLRRVDDGRYSFVGECYVHGLMDGEVWEHERSGPIELQEFRII
jgi:hypothetical protein